MAVNRKGVKRAVQQMSPREHGFIDQIKEAALGENQKVSPWATSDYGWLERFRRWATTPERTVSDMPLTVDKDAIKQGLRYFNNRELYGRTPGYTLTLTQGLLSKPSSSGVLSDEQLQEFMRFVYGGER